MAIFGIYPLPTHMLRQAGPPFPCRLIPQPLPYPDGNASEQIERSEIPSPVFSGEGVAFCGPTLRLPPYPD